MLTANLSKVFVPLREALLWVPTKLSVLAGFAPEGFYLLSVIWLSIFMPLLIFTPALVLYGLSDRAAKVQGAPVSQPDPPLQPPSEPESLWSTLGYLVYPTLPVLIGGHLMLAVVKLNAKLAYLPSVLADPLGSRSYLAFHVYKLTPAPGVIIGLDILKWILAALLLFCLFWSLRISWVSRLERRSPGLFFVSASIASISLWLLYGATLVRWLFIR